MGVNMTKIMLVEDDKSLREIYGVRLLAEGYEIISAGDGEAALAMAVKEKPNLILSDVMMPKISGFDMLDILRATPETKDIKVIMMTALSSEDQRARGESLGANRYLVKSQVGIEDVVRTVHDVLADAPVTAAPTIQRFGIPAQSAAIVNQPVSVTPRPLSPPPVLSNQATEPVSHLVPQPLSQPVGLVEALQPVIAPTPDTVVPVKIPTQVVEPSPVDTQEPTHISAPAPVAEPEYAPAPVFNPEPVVPAPAPLLESVPTTPTPVTVIDVVEPPAAAPAPVEVIAAPVVVPTQMPQPTAPFSTPAPAGLGDRIINPISPAAPTLDMSALIDQELNDGSDTIPQNPLQ